MSYVGSSPWTAERLDALRKLWAEGFTAGQIADKLGGVTRNGVISKVHRLGLVGRERAKPVSAVRVARAGNLNNPTRLLAKINGHDPGLKPPPKPKIDLSAGLDIPVEQRRTLLELTEHTCRWPVGDPGEPDFFFCGGPSDNFGGRPYCPYHTALASCGMPRVRAFDPTAARPRVNV